MKNYNNYSRANIQDLYFITLDKTKINKKKLISILESGKVDINKQNFSIGAGLHILLSNLVIVEALTYDIIKILLDYGIDINIQNKKGETALMWSTWNKNSDGLRIVELLIENGADINILSNKGETALHWSINNSRGEGVLITKKLIDSGIDLDIKNNQGDSSLIKLSKNLQDFTSYHGRINKKIYKQLQYILDSDSDWMLRDNSNNTFIDYLPEEIIGEIIEKYPEKYKEYQKVTKRYKFNL